MAGYSSKPLIKKLGIKPGTRVAFVSEPQGFRKELGELPEGVKVGLAKEMDAVLLFCKSQADYQKHLGRIEPRLAQAGMLWAIWPKKSSGVATDLSFDAVQKAGLAAGLVDVKICAVDEMWSGLKFVRRLRDRAK